MKTVILLVLLFPGFQAAGQTSADSIRAEDVSESVIEDTAVYTESDSAYTHVQYTQKPGELTVTKQEQQKNYKARKFNKTEWKKIVGETNYAEEPSKKNPNFPNLALDPVILKVTGYIVIFGLIAFLIFLFVKNALRDSDRKINRQEAALFTDQTSPQDIPEDDIEKLLREALAQGNLRIAVRLYYIKLLKHLNAEGHIQWGKNKTNRDYANELSLSGFSREFRRLMIAYEYVWYGERTPSPEEFHTLQSNFEALFRTQRS